MEQMQDRDLVKAKTLIETLKRNDRITEVSQGVLERVVGAAEQYLELSSAVTWQTSCLNCSKLLDRLSALDLAVLKLLEDNPEFRDDPSFAEILKARDT